MSRFLRRLCILGVLGLGILGGCQKPADSSGIIQTQKETSPVFPMPVHPTVADGSGLAPIELRDEKVWRWMSGEFRIENRVGRGTIYGSGTLCYYDRKTNTGYIISCGHLFEGNEKTMTVTTWYKNGKKLTSPASYTAQVICFDKREDIAFFKFTPDWVPNEYFPIAPIASSPTSGTRLWSIGCDGGREVATYDVRVVGMEGEFLITRENSPRRGRSGGGLVTPDGWYVGICVRSSDPDNGTGTGLFVPLSRIHPYCQRNNLGFLLNLSKRNGSAVGEFPIVDRVGPQGTYPKDYIPVP